MVTGHKDKSGKFHPHTNILGTPSGKSNAIPKSSLSIKPVVYTPSPKNNGNTTNEKTKNMRLHSIASYAIEKAKNAHKKIKENKKKREEEKLKRYGENKEKAEKAKEQFDEIKNSSATDAEKKAKLDDIKKQWASDNVKFNTDDNKEMKRYYNELEKNLKPVKEQNDQNQNKNQDQMDLGLRLAMLRVGINPDVPSEKTKQDERKSRRRMDAHNAIGSNTTTSPTTPAPTTPAPTPAPTTPAPTPPQKEAD